MDVPYQDILAVIREPGGEKASFDGLREIATKRMNWQNWDQIRLPSLFATDVLEAAKWFDEALLAYQPTGVYLGLDTLNENDGMGKNLEIGMTTKADPEVFNIRRAYECERYGEKHLIWGLYELHQSYKNLDLQYPASVLADYIFFLGYSGMVLAAALERSSFRRDCIFVWGFHDGDLFLLSRTSAAGVVRLARSCE